MECVGLFNIHWTAADEKWKYRKLIEHTRNLASIMSRKIDRISFTFEWMSSVFSISNLIAERKIIVLRYQLGIIRRLVFRERYTAALCGNDAWFASQMNEKQQHQKPTILDKRLIIISIWCWPFWWWWLVHSLILTWILFLVNFPWIYLRVAFHWENGFDDLYIRWPASKTIRIEPNHHSYGWRYTHLRPNFLLSCDSCRLLYFSFFVIQ